MASKIGPSGPLFCGINMYYIMEGSLVSFKDMQGEEKLGEVVTNGPKGVLLREFKGKDDKIRMFRYKVDIELVTKEDRPELFL